MLIFIGAVITAIFVSQARSVLKLVETNPELYTIALSFACLYWLAMTAIRISL